MLSERRFAIVSLVIGIIGLFYSGLIAGGIAITFAIISIAKDYRGDEATAGLVLGLICMCLMLVQIMGLDFAFRLEINELYNYMLWISRTPESIITPLGLVLNMTNRHVNAITTAVFTGGATPFYWIYTFLYML